MHLCMWEFYVDPPLGGGLLTLYRSVEDDTWSYPEIRGTFGSSNVAIDLLLQEKESQEDSTSLRSPYSVCYF